MKQKKKQKPTRLTALQERFVHEYIMDPTNMAQAAVRAGYAPGSAHTRAHENMSKDYIQAEIDRRLKKTTKKLEVTEKNWVQQIAEAAFFDVRKLFDEKGNLLPVKDLPEEVARAIAGMDIATDAIGRGKAKLYVHTKKIKMVDKNKALNMMGKYLGLFKKDNQQRYESLREILEEIDGATRGLPRPAGRSADPSADNGAPAGQVEEAE